MRAVVVDADAPARLALGAVEAPVPERSEALVRVQTISLNRGEVGLAQRLRPGSRPGSDFAGVVEQPAADRTGPRAGERVVGIVPTRAWAEFVAVPVRSLAALPTAVSPVDAAALPVAGLTALYALERGGLLLGRNVLVTGASGGVGHLAVQLAAHAGARVTGLVRQARHAEVVRGLGAHNVVSDETGERAGEFGPFDLILESVGGDVLRAALTMLAPGGRLVSYGVSAGAQVTFDAGRFLSAHGAAYETLLVFSEIQHQPAALGLGRLSELVASGALRPSIGVEASWREVGGVAQRLLDRDFAGKAVLHVEAEQG